eukprot:scaffold16857_cov22-Cyclotella_meneghiniana.AAC.2
MGVMGVKHFNIAIEDWTKTLPYQYQKVLSVEQDLDSRRGSIPLEMAAIGGHPFDRSTISFFLMLFTFLIRHVSSPPEPSPEPELEPEPDFDFDDQRFKF